MSLGGSDDYDLCEVSDDEEYEQVSEKDAVMTKASEYTTVETAREEIQAILDKHKKGNWGRDVYMQMICFDGFIQGIEQEINLGRRGPLTVLEIQGFVLGELSKTFIATLPKLLGSEGWSKLKKEIESCALAWKIPSSELDAAAAAAAKAKLRLR